MAELLSRNSKIAVSTNDVAYSDVAGTRDDLSFDVTRDEIDTTDRDSSGWKTNQPGRGSASFSFTAHYDKADAGQAAIATAALAGNQLYFRMRPATGAGNSQFKQICTITSFKVSSPNDALCLMSVTAKVSGDPTTADQ